LANFDHPPIDVSFNQLLSFGREGFNRPLVLGSDKRMVELHRFRQKLALSLLDAGIREPGRMSFTPHMTLLYDKQMIQPREIDPIRWRLDELVLVDSLRSQPGMCRSPAGDCAASRMAEVKGPSSTSLALSIRSPRLARPSPTAPAP
jgi:2'-5' RNA ligase